MNIIITTKTTRRQNFFFFLIYRTSSSRVCLMKPSEQRWTLLCLRDTTLLPVASPGSSTAWPATLIISRSAERRSSKCWWERILSSGTVISIMNIMTLVRHQTSNYYKQNAYVYWSSVPISNFINPRQTKLCSISIVLAPISVFFSLYVYLTVWILGKTSVKYHIPQCALRNPCACTLLFQEWEGSCPNLLLFLMEELFLQVRFLPLW